MGRRFNFFALFQLKEEEKRKHSSFGYRCPSVVSSTLKKKPPPQLSSFTILYIIYESSYQILSSSYKSIVYVTNATTACFSKPTTPFRATKKRRKSQQPQHHCNSTGGPGTTLTLFASTSAGRCVSSPSTSAGARSSSPATSTGLCDAFPSTSALHFPLSRFDHRLLESGISDTCGLAFLLRRRRRVHHIPNTIAMSARAPTAEPTPIPVFAELLSAEGTGVGDGWGEEVDDTMLLDAPGEGDVVSGKATPIFVASDDA
ncbi:unnamed protein product [Periconia digitata]|uniref:Uncharacterized protein n=1 Tax=Periconia digitata TaxID=1303443 RepID=A0A9W4XWU8_9PLEO|nr:unnamed protein product [Periconia digitata]